MERFARSIPSLLQSNMYTHAYIHRPLGEEAWILGGTTPRITQLLLRAYSVNICNKLDLKM